MQMLRVAKSAKALVYDAGLDPLSPLSALGNLASASKVNKALQARLRGAASAAVRPAGAAPTMPPWGRWRRQCRGPADGAAPAVPPWGRWRGQCRASVGKRCKHHNRNRNARAIAAATPSWPPRSCRVPATPCKRRGGAANAQCHTVRTCAAPLRTAGRESVRTPPPRRREAWGAASATHPNTPGTRLVALPSRRRASKRYGCRVSRRRKNFRTRRRAQSPLGLYGSRLGFRWSYSAFSDSKVWRQ